MLYCAYRARFCFLARRSQSFDKGCGIIEFEAIFGGLGGGWRHTIAGRRETGLEREMPMADVVAASGDKVYELVSARVGAGMCIGLVLDRGGMPLGEGDFPTRCEDSTGAPGIRLIDWRWAFVFCGVGERGDVSPKVASVDV